MASLRGQRPRPDLPRGSAIWRLAGGPARRLLATSRAEGVATAARAQPAGPAQVTLAALRGQPLRPALPTGSGVWRLSGGPARQLLSAARAEITAAHAASLPVAVAAAPRPLISRRTAILGSFWTALGLGLTTALGGLDFLYPRRIAGFGGPIPVPAEQIPKPGGPPVHIIKGKLWLVNLKAGEGAYGEFGVPSEEGGLLALWQKCPHLGCTVPWREDFLFGGVKSWFRCPCHGSTYTRAGVRVFGPAPRPMDTMKIEVQSDGSVIVQTGQITQGAADNPKRSVPYRT